MSDNYVYLHKRKDNGLVFYIGEGRLNRSTTRLKRSKKWNQIVAQTDFEVKYLHVNLTKQEAVELEGKYLISPDPSWKLINECSYRPTIDINREMFCDCLVYDESSPSGLKWSKILGKRTRRDLIAGHKDCRGYWTVRVNNRSYAAHRVVWVLHNKLANRNCVINHINNNPSDNRISNLEEVSLAVNARRSINQIEIDASGILYEERQNGRYKYWVAYYHDVRSKRFSKAFNCDSLGFDIAKQMAIDWRRENLIIQNTQGAGYNV